MLHPSLDTFRKDLDRLSQRLQTLRQDLRERDLFSDAHKAVLDRVQEERDLLAAKLSDAERNPPNWDRIKREFGAAWNSFVTDLNVLELRLQDAETAKQQEA
jgi:hypothetical protein